VPARLFIQAGVLFEPPSYAALRRAGTGTEAPRNTKDIRGGCLICLGVRVEWLGGGWSG
jgi:hypothetical protein